MIIDSSNTRQRNILTNKCFYQTTAQIMHDFEQKGYANSADETLKVINAYHSLIKKKVKNNFNADYNAAFQKIDDAIKMLANKVYYEYDRRSYDEAYRSFEEFDYVNAIIGPPADQKVKLSPNSTAYAYSRPTGVFFPPPDTPEDSRQMLFASGRFLDNS